MAWVFGTNHREGWSKNKGIPDYIRHPILGFKFSVQNVLNTRLLSCSILVVWEGKFLTVSWVTLNQMISQIQDFLQHFKLLNYTRKGKQTHSGQRSGKLKAQCEWNELKGARGEKLGSPSTYAVFSYSSFSSVMIWQHCRLKEVCYLESTSLLPETRLKSKDSRVRDVIVL